MVFPNKKSKGETQGNVSDNVYDFTSWENTTSPAVTAGMDCYWSREKLGDNTAGLDCYQYTEKLGNNLSAVKHIFKILTCTFTYFFQREKL